MLLYMIGQLLILVYFCVCMTACMWRCVWVNKACGENRIGPSLLCDCQRLRSALLSIPGQLLLYSHQYFLSLLFFLISWFVHLGFYPFIVSFQPVSYIQKSKYFFLQLFIALIFFFEHVTFFISVPLCPSCNMYLNSVFIYTFLSIFVSFFFND